jgi:hypothetical protein
VNPLPDQSASASRTYTIYVCAVCGSDNIDGGTPSDSHCGDCENWMNVVPVVVAPVEGEPAFDEDRDG